MTEIWIDTKIVYEPGRKLARAYNRAMETTAAPWVLFLDQDLFICNPHWYEMSLAAVDQVGDVAGWITCVCNRIGNPGQRRKPDPDTDNVIDHIAHARHLYETHGKRVKRFKGALSGFFILTSKRAWAAAGGFNEARGGMLGVDNDYSRAVQKAGFGLFGMPGLYFYHLYKKKRRVMRW